MNQKVEPMAHMFGVVASRLTRFRTPEQQPPPSNTRRWLRTEREARVANVDTMDQLETPASDSESAGRDDILDAINGALNKIEAAGSFGGFARLPDLKDLGLSVHGVGDIALPLQETQARQLIAQSRQAPFGKGSDTVVDTAVRNTWELDAAQFEFRRDRWPKILDGCIKFVGQALGITSPIRAEPYKMLIYEKGAMFKAHTESVEYSIPLRHCVRRADALYCSSTEKIPGMFGTLVVCLPSPHQGGDVVLKHHGKTKTYRTSQVQPSVLCCKQQLLLSVPAAAFSGVVLFQASEPAPDSAPELPT